MNKKTNTIESDRLIELGRAVIKTEADAVTILSDRINQDFVTACQHILECKGRTVVIGMGKSGHIGNKIAATLASTGTPAFFVHPGEASHGDLGMITEDDVVIALSNSGETDEIMALLPVIKRLNVPLITLTGNLESTLAKSSTVKLDVSVAEEACPLGLAGTNSQHNSDTGHGRCPGDCLTGSAGFQCRRLRTGPSGRCPGTPPVTPCQ